MKNIVFILICISVRLTAQHPKEAEQHFEAAHKALVAHQYTDAITNFTKGLQVNPGYYEGYLYRGMAKNNIDDLGGALSDYSIFLEHEPRNAEALFQRGFLHYSLEHFDQAKVDFEQLLSLPNLGETNSILYRMPAFGTGADKLFTSQNGQKDYIFNYLGLCEGKLGNHANAIHHYDTAIALNSNDAAYFVHRGLTYQQIGDLKRARNDFQAALRIDPNNGLALNNLGVLSRNQSQQDSTEYFLTAAINRSPNLPYPWAERGYYWLKRNEFARAEMDYSKAIQIMPKDHELWLNRGIARINQGKLESALADLTRAVDLKPDFSMGFMNRGNVYYRLKNYNQAIEDYSIAIIYDKEYGLAYYNRALAYKAINELGKSCADLQRAADNGIKVSTKLRARVCQQP